MGLGGHSATTWTEFCYFLTPSPLSVDRFFTLSVDKNRQFLTPSPLHLVHIVIECLQGVYLQLCTVMRFVHFLFSPNLR